MCRLWRTWPISLLLWDSTGAQSPGERGLLDGRIIREIRIDGLKQTRRETVLRQLASKIGEPYTTGAEEADRRLLDRLTIFSSIQVTPRLEGDGVALDIRVKETFPYSLYPSISSSQENGISVGPAFGAINMAGRGIQMSLTSEFGGATNFSFRIKTPLLTQRRWWFETGYARTMRDNNLFHFPEQSQTADAFAGYQISKSLRLIGQLSFLAIRSTQAGVTLNGSGTDKIPTFSVGLQYDTRNLWTNSTSGWYFHIDSSRNGFFGGDGDWWTHNAEFRRYQRLSDRNTAAVFSLLSLQSGTPGRDLPTYMQYGIGGTNAVRGWNIDARIGKNQWLSTVEYRYELVKVRPIRFFRYNAYWGIHLAIYGDLGTAWTEGGQFAKNFIGSGGYGVRLVIPYVGMIRFDRAYGNALRPCWAIGDRVETWRDRVR